MRTLLVITVTGSDRRGIVDRLSETVVSHRANWEESRMARLAGRFAGILTVAVDPASADALVHDLVALAGEDLAVSVAPVEGEDPFESHRPLTLELTGADHEGIVRDVSRLLAARGVSIDELSSETFSAPMSGVTMFRAEAELRCPRSLTLDDLREGLEQLADDLVVDIRIEESKDES